MKRGLVVLGGIALVVLFALLIALNPGEVEFRPTHLHSFRPMLGVLLILTFCAGGALVLLGGGLRQLSTRLADWRARRGARTAAQAAAWHQEGEAAAWSGELERSRTLLRKAWERRSGNSPAALALASSYMDTGEYAAAQEVLQGALEEDPNDADLRYALGEALRRRGETAEAIRMLETLRVRFPRAPRVLISLRELYRDAERWGEAADCQAAYLEGLPPRARGGEARRLVELRYQAALALPDAPERAAGLDAVVQSDRGFVPAQVSLGDALADSGRLDEAMKLWRKRCATSRGWCSSSACWRTSARPRARSHPGPARQALERARRRRRPPAPGARGAGHRGIRHRRARAARRRPPGRADRAARLGRAAPPARRPRRRLDRRQPRRRSARRRRRRPPLHRLRPPQRSLDRLLQRLRPVGHVSGGRSGVNRRRNVSSSLGLLGCWLLVLTGPNNQQPSSSRPAHAATRCGIIRRSPLRSCRSSSKLGTTATTLRLGSWRRKDSMRTWSPRACIS
ncbi:MAG: tetratricopeptide repeat protein [Candidatus Binatia bacterium]